jgi:hypothetical protein
MVPERCLTLALERLLRPEGILVNPVECGEMSPDYSARQVPQCVGPALQLFPFPSERRHD